MARRLDARKPNKQGEKPQNLVILIVLMAIGIFCLLPLFPPFGLIWCFAVGKVLFQEARKQNILKKDVEGKYSMDWNRGKSAVNQSARELKTQSQETSRRVKTRISESDRMEEHQPYEHAHNPVNYSYDACAVQRRLEQIKSLKDAGILDEREYQQRKARILAGK